MLTRTPHLVLAATAAALLLTLTARADDPAPTPTPFEPYACSLGTVVGVDAGSYLIATPAGHTIGIKANGEASAANVEADIAHPGDELANAKAAKLAAIYATAAPGVLAAFDALPPGVQAQFAPVKSAALKAASGGDFASAKTIVETCVLPSDLQAIQASLAAQLAPLVDAQQAIAASASVEDVAAVTLPTPTPSPTPTP
jgi:hypothetical protein